ncbi:MAG: carboxypeptidase-like regulatory domain-containing protein, partial [Planctomycetota bacterium]
NRIQAVVAEDDSMLFENVIGGTYVLRVQLDSGVWLQQNVEIEGGVVEQTIQLDPVPEETATVRGNFLNAAPIDLFLTTANQNIHIDIAPNADGTYELAAIPSDIYSLAAFVKGQLIEFTQIDLQNEPQMTLDIDPTEMMRAFSPLTVVVTNASGIVLSDAQVWLTGIGGEDLVTASSTGRGAFLAAPAGQYTLSIAHPEYLTENREIILKTSSLLAEPIPENTVLVQLGIQEAEKGT